ncbi:diguanylate cyclase [Candidatus Magnetominusculus xianensis]|uniref:Diguanylate cyclase n=1 Tax=Candidatus Magnetominusculus xianensis TaxID=1748249 RepID=A0ABR5SE33_9BACT|nr:diguanylate cyclase [Candidatus Magnetominusculus xianensis]KWT84052.1 diguanylate cyclase [Candidatus Magnetominusculus xianensis]MBF0402345.1 diguanylate cyclase [Nitrospirota bacterium]
MKQIRSIKTKLLIRIILSFVLLSIIIQAIVIASFRNFGMDASKERGLSVAEIIRDAITSFMILGVYDKRDIFLDRLKYAHGIKDIRVLRGKSVIQQFGQSEINGKTPTLLEEQVLDSGNIKSAVKEDLLNLEYVIVIPYKAVSNERVRCLQCHKATEGEVLGAVTVVIDLTKQRRSGVSVMSYMVAVSLFFSLGTLYIIYIFFKPYTELFLRLRYGFEHASEGDFSKKVEVALADEAGDVAKGFNIMTDNLSKTLSSIDNKVSILIGYQITKTANALKDTTRTVDMLVKIYNFKRTIEKDAVKNDIFMRIEQMLIEMGIENFSIYEAKLDKNTITNVISRADMENSARLGINGESSKVSWCDESILTDAGQCRAIRTGSVVNSQEFPLLCQNFICSQACSLDYYCIPIYIGGRVGDVLQIVYGKGRDEFTMTLIPFIKAYLLECEPVIEGKTFMELLREQSLVDQLTGLYNRRFLDEINNSLCRAAIRRKTLVGILLIDIDHFKHVNDTYGHDIGDKVLQKAASIIKASVRESDIVIRYGGEEILVLLVDAAEGNSIEVAQKICSNFQNESIEIPSGALNKTVSIGVSEFPKNSDKFWTCVKYSDTALYKAKNDGRNRAYLYKEDT